uniref:Putative secreted protein n=1 Tax=Anopheles darlingi TaxID=43151 RepID=A0A2M4DQV4_ANODA
MRWACCSTLPVGLLWYVTLSWIRSRDPGTGLPAVASDLSGLGTGGAARAGTVLLVVSSLHLATGATKATFGDFLLPLLGALDWGSG